MPLYLIIDTLLSHSRNPTTLGKWPFKVRVFPVPQCHGDNRKVQPSLFG